jgi:hypothetical protein
MNDYRTAMDNVGAIINSWDEGKETVGLNNAVDNHRGITDAQAENIIKQRAVLNSYMDPSNPYIKNMNIKQIMGLRGMDLAKEGQDATNLSDMYTARVQDIAKMVEKLKEQWQTRVDAAKIGAEGKKGLFDMQFGKEKLDAENANAAANRAATLSAAKIQAAAAPTFGNDLYKNIDSLAQTMLDKYVASGQGKWNHNVREQIVAALGGGDPALEAKIKAYLPNGFENRYIA